MRNLGRTPKSPPLRLAPTFSPLGIFPEAGGARLLDHAQETLDELFVDPGGRNHPSIEPA